MQAQVNSQLWEKITQILEGRTMEHGQTGDEVAVELCPIQLVVRVQKMMADDEPEAYLNTFERSATIARCLQEQWMSILISCLIGLAQLAVNTLMAAKVADYRKIKAAILHVLNSCTL